MSTVDARGNPGQFGYSAKFQLTGTTNDAGDWVVFNYNATDGTLASRTDPVTFILSQLGSSAGGGWRA